MKTLSISLLAAIVALQWNAGPPSLWTGALVFSTMGTHTHETTATGTVSVPTFTGASFDNRSAFMSVIACRVD